MNKKRLSYEVIDELSNEDLILLQDMVLQHSGVKVSEFILPKLKKYINENFKKSSYAEMHDYILYLTKLPRRSLQIDELISEITIDESYFFRNNAMFNYLRDKWLPTIIKRKTEEDNKVLRIWSSGCASGQEIYSVAIMLKEFIKDINTWEVHLLGSDINTKALACAQKGEYGEWSFRGDKAYINKYFKQDKKYTINEDIKNMVKLRYINLVDYNYPSIFNETYHMDLILCCNVFIYFTENYITRVTRKIAKCLVNEGLLLLAPSDHVDKVPLSLQQVNVGSFKCYKRIIAKKSDTMKSKNDIKEHVASANITAKEGGIEKTQVLLYQQMCDEKWQDALRTVDLCLKEKKHNVDLIFIKAKIMANLGMLEKAYDLCCSKELSLTINPEVNLLRALILLELNRADEAESYLHKAIEADKQFVEASYYLALLLLQKKNFKAGIAMLEETLAVVQSINESLRLRLTPAISYGNFAKTIERQLTIYKDY